MGVEACGTQSSSHGGSPTDNRQSYSGVSIMDGGCFVSQGDTMVCTDPSNMRYLSTIVCNDLNVQDQPKVPCVLIHPTKPGLWAIYGLVSSTTASNRGSGNSDSMGDGDNADSSVLEIILLNTPDIPTDSVSVELLGSLSWTPFEGLPEFHSPTPWANSRSTVDVDVGQCGIFCKDSIERTLNELKRKKSDDRDKALNAWYDRICELTCIGYQLGVSDMIGLPLGVVCASGCSDSGSYKVEILKDEPGLDVWGIRVVFLPH